MAYQTVLFDFPSDNWYKAYYGQRANETIVEYLPNGQTRNKYTETVVFHSYKWAYNRNMTPQSMMADYLSQSALRYRDLELSSTKNDGDEPTSIWCSAMAGQCEIVRMAKGFEGIIAMHYVNKNPQYFQKVFPTWANVLKNTRVYYSYYRWDTIMNKASSVQL